MNRGVPPKGGGEVILSVPIVKELQVNTLILFLLSYKHMPALHYEIQLLMYCSFESNRQLFGLMRAW